MHLFCILDHIWVIFGDMGSKRGSPTGACWRPSFGAHITEYHPNMVQNVNRMYFEMQPYILAMLTGPGPTTLGVWTKSPKMVLGARPGSIRTNMNMQA